MNVFILILTMTFNGEALAITAIEMGSQSSCIKAGNKWLAETKKRHKYVRTSFTCNETIKLKAK